MCKDAKDDKLNKKVNKSEMKFQKYKILRLCESININFINLNYLSIKSLKIEQQSRSLKIE